MMRSISWLLCAFIVVGFVAIQWQFPEFFDSKNQSKRSGNALIGGEFSLTTHENKPFTHKDLEGKFHLIYFGFTHCPDICPTTLLIVGNALNKLGEDAKRITPVFISLDPERDSTEVLSRYVKHFHPTLIGLTGSDEQIKTVTDAYKVYYQKVEQPDSPIKYMVDHSGYVFLMGPDGKYITHFSHDISEQKLAATLKQELESY